MDKKIIVGGGLLFFLLLGNKSKAATSYIGPGGTTNSGNGFIPTQGSEGSANESYLHGNYPRGVRNNNPGNIKYSSSNNWQGKIPISQNTDAIDVDGEPRFEQYYGYIYGVRAMIHMLKNSYIPSGRNTLRIIMLDNWAPDGGSSYLNYVVGKTGKGPDTIIASTDETTIKKLVQAIARFENNRKESYHPEVITDLQYQAARNLVS